MSRDKPIYQGQLDKDYYDSLDDFITNKNVVKRIRDLTKVYSNNLRYRREGYKVLQDKYIVFIDLYNQVAILYYYYILAFSITPKDRARDYYYKNLSIPLKNDLSSIFLDIEAYFKTKERY